MRYPLLTAMMLLHAAGCGVSSSDESVAESTQALSIGPIWPQPPVSLTTLNPNQGFAGVSVAVNGANLIRTGVEVRTYYRFSNDTSGELATVVRSGTKLFVTVPPGSAGGSVCVYSILRSAPISCTTNALTIIPSAPNPCSLLTCLGCCNGQTCWPANFSAELCGINASQCRACPVGQRCQSGACQTPPPVTP